MITITPSKVTLTAASSCVPTPYETFQNGGFECGIYPWRARVTHGTTYAVTSPGKSGLFAFEVDREAPFDGVRLAQATLSQLFNLTTGTQYVLTFDTNFSNRFGGYFLVPFNGQALYTVDARAGSGPGVWRTSNIAFTATRVPSQYLIEFEFVFGSTSAVAKVDNVILTP
ncbi:hypothetical protein LTR28_000009, partial [Elasticomyces elasticus]